MYRQRSAGIFNYWLASYSFSKAIGELIKGNNDRQCGLD